MDFEIIRSTQEMEKYAKEWNELLNKSASDVPFLRYEYLHAWWLTLGGGEWMGGDLYIIVDRSVSGELRGIAPFFMTENPAGKTAIMFLGSVEISDYLDIIAPSDHVGDFVGRLLEHIGTISEADWQTIDLYNILEDSTTIPHLKEKTAQMGWAYHEDQLQPCPLITLPGDWETYLAGISKKQRHEIRRKLRRAENYPGGVRWYIVEDENTLNQEIDSLIHLMGQDPLKAEFLSEAMVSQMGKLVHAAFKEGWLQLAFLEVGGSKAAVYFNFDYANRIWVYNSGIDFNYRELSPGWVLLSNLLQWANENKRVSFDFMRGDEAYKLRFGGVPRYVKRLRIDRP